MRQTYFLAFLAISLFFSCKPATPAADSDKKPEEIKVVETPQPVTSNYLLMFEKDVNAFQVTVNPDNSAEGYLAWEPFEKDSGRGFFEGKKEGDLLTGDFTYMIEGAIQTEEVVFKIVEGGIAKGRGPLDDSGDRFVIIDKSSLNFDDVYKTVEASKIAPSIKNAKAISDIIKGERSKRYESLTGTYNYELGNDQGTGELLVKQLENNQVKIAFNIVMHAPGLNQGEGEGIITLNQNLEGDYAVDEFDKECKIRFIFRGKKVISKQTAGDFADCGFGNGVVADQEFIKSNSVDPFVK